MPSKCSKIAAAQQAEKTKTAAGEGDGVRYNLKNTTDKNVVSIKQQIENVAQELNSADPVARKTVFNIFGSMNIKQKRAWAEAEALKYRNRVDRQEYGSIEVSRTIPPPASPSTRASSPKPNPKPKKNSSRPLRRLKSWT